MDELPIPGFLRAAAAVAAVAALLSGCAAAAGVYREPAAGVEFVPVPGGCFLMGDVFGDGEKDELPVHEVCVSDFRMGRTEVTVAQFRKFVEATGYRTDAEKGNSCNGLDGKKYGPVAGMSFRNASYLGRTQDGTHPVVCVSPEDAGAFVDWLARASGKPFRLPTEAEWEYAARDGGKRVKYSRGGEGPSGNVLDESLKRAVVPAPASAWDGYDDGYVFTAPAGSFRANGLGLSDMTGNVWEWCSDRYGEAYYGSSPRVDPTGPPEGGKRVARGGSWFGSPAFARVTDRGFGSPDERNHLIGFRVVLPGRD